MAESKISIQDIKKLRELTGAGMQDAQKALAETSGDISKAQEYLRRKGVATAAKKSARAAKDGVIATYVHGQKVGVLVEVNCETDFVAKTDDFQNFVHEVALQIAAVAPRYVSRQEVPQDLVDKEISIFKSQVEDQKKPAAVQEKIIAGKLDKFYEETCLLEQASIKDPKIKVQQMLTDVISKVGENIVISRFVRYQLGETQS